MAGTITQDGFSPCVTPGVIFLMNVDSVEQAKAAVEKLPLVTGGFATYDRMPVGPLAPLGLLLQPK